MKPISDIRRENLARLVREQGSQVAVASAIGKDKNQIHQWLLMPGVKGARNIGHASARSLEKTFSKPIGWLDSAHEQDNSAATHTVRERIGQSTSLDRPAASQVSDAIQKNIPSGARNLRTESVIVREGIVMVANFFEANHGEVRVEDDLDLLVKGYEAQKASDPDLWEEIYSEIEARVRQRELQNGQGQNGVEGARAAARKR